MADGILSEQLQAYLESGRSGTVMAVMKDNSLGRIYIVNGVPASARYKNLQGSEAFLELMPMQTATVKFHNNADLVRSSVLLSGVAAEEIKAAETTPAKSTEAAPSTVHPNAVPLTDIGRSRLAELLAEYIGPVAPLVMSDLPGNVDVDSALSMVSQEIDNTRRAAEFIAAARRIL